MPHRTSCRTRISPSCSLANDCTDDGLEDDIIPEPFNLVNGKIAVPAKPGLGVDGDAAKLGRYGVEC